MKRILAGLLAACCVAAVASRAADATAPDVLAKSVTEEVLAVLRADKEIQAGNQKRLADLVEKKVLPHFNFTRMTQLAVGRHWREASPEQQQALVDEFRGLLVQTYAATFMAYRDLTIEYRPVRIQPDDTDAVIKSYINQTGGKAVTVDYRMHKSAAGWKVYDVVVADLSLVQTYRGTFNSEVQKGGVDGLIKALVAKNKQLAEK